MFVFLTTALPFSRRDARSIRFSAIALFAPPPPQRPLSFRRRRRIDPPPFRRRRAPYLFFLLGGRKCSFPVFFEQPHATSLFFSPLRPRRSTDGTRRKKRRELSVSFIFLGAILLGNREDSFLPFLLQGRVFFLGSEFSPSHTGLVPPFSFRKGKKDGTSSASTMERSLLSGRLIAFPPPP